MKLQVSIDYLISRKNVILKVITKRTVTYEDESLL